MLKKITKQLKLYILSLTTNRPLALSLVNIVIARNSGLSIVIKATIEKLQALENILTLSLIEIIKNINWENGYLREELVY